VANGASSGRNVADTPAKKGVIVMLGAAAVAGAAVAMVAYRKRSVVTKAHPLAGSLSKRMNLFQSIAGHHSHNKASRPSRVVEVAVDDNYHRAEEIQMV
jgi:hypothetical protein